MGTLLMIMLALYGTIAGGSAASRAPHASPSQAAPAPRAESEAPNGQTAGPTSGRLLVVGDSLAVGTEAPLARLLPGWRIATSAYTGRHTDDGVAEITGRGGLPDVIAVSLGTNDDPSATSSFAGEVQRVLDAAGPAKCVVWANIVRPPYAGVSYRGYNRALADEDGRRDNLLVLNWKRMVHRHPEWLADDGVHVSAEGYQARAHAVAKLVRRCA
jgi:lysophospholipase L1-like esterase